MNKKIEENYKKFFKDALLESLILSGSFLACFMLLLIVNTIAKAYYNL